MGIKSAGLVQTGADGYFYFVDTEGNWRRIKLWIEDKCVGIASMEDDAVSSYAEGEVTGLAEVPVGIPG